MINLFTIRSPTRISAFRDHRQTRPMVLVREIPKHRKRTPSELKFEEELPYTSFRRNSDGETSSKQRILDSRTDHSRRTEQPIDEIPFAPLLRLQGSTSIRIKPRQPVKRLPTMNLYEMIRVPTMIDGREDQRGVPNNYQKLISDIYLKKRTSQTIQSLVAKSTVKLSTPKTSSSMKISMRSRTNRSELLKRCYTQNSSR